MADFVVEFHPKSHPGFDCRNHDISPKQQVPPLNIPKLDQQTIAANQARPTGMPRPDSPPRGNDEAILSMISDKHFSKEAVTELLTGSILTLITKLLTGRSMTSIKGLIQVSLLDDSVPISISLNKVLIDNNSSSSLSSPLLSSSHHFDEHLNVRIKESLMPNCAYSRTAHSPDSGMSDTHSVNGDVTNDVTRSDTVTRQDSDEESGYSSTYEHSLSVPGGFSPKSISRNVSQEVCGGQRLSYEIPECMEEGASMLEEPELFSKRHVSLEKASVDTDPETSRDNEDVSDDAGETPELVIDLNPAADEIQEKNSKLSSDSNCHFSEMTSDDDVQDGVRDTTKAGESLVNAASSLQMNLDTEKNEQHVDKENYPVAKMTEADAESTTHSDNMADYESHSEESSEGNGSASSALKQNLISKLDTGALSCTECHQILPDIDSVSRHAFEVHNLFSCSFCFKTFTAKNNLKRHIRLHTGIRPYKCPHCPQAFARRDDMKAHAVRHQHSKPFRCGICKKGYIDRACVKNHMAKEHDSRLMHVCPQCGESFDNGDAFSAHKKSHPELKQFACQECLFIGTNALMTIKHKLIHKHALFTCKPCNAFFADPFDYTLHLRRHKTDSNFSSYSCCFCKASFSSYEQFVRHEYSHAQGKYFSCKVCKKQFKTKTALLDHSFSHSETNENNSGTVGPITAIDENKALQTSSESLPIPRTEQQGHCCSSIASSESYDALDLSVKKPSTHTDDIHSVFNIPATVNRFCFGSAAQSDFTTGVPRNGYTPMFDGRCGTEAESVPSSRGEQMTSQANTSPTLVPHTLVPTTPEEIQAYNSRLRMSHESLSNAAKAILNNNNNRHAPQEQQMPVSQNRSDRESLIPYIQHNLRQKMLRSVSGGESRQRMSPYSRNKLVELASKYIAARGPLSNSALRESLMRMTSHVNTSSGGMAQTGDATEQNTHSQTPVRSPDQTPRRFAFKESRLERSLSHQTPVFVKSEPMLERDETQMQFVQQQQQQQKQMQQQFHLQQQLREVSHHDTRIESSGHLKYPINQQHFSESNTAYPHYSTSNSSQTSPLTPSSFNVKSQQQQQQQQHHQHHQQIQQQLRLQQQQKQRHQLQQQQKQHYQSMEQEKMRIHNTQHQTSPSTSSSPYRDATAVIKAIANPNKIHACELCKEVFENFNDLEAHSVAHHKRYLCEHCGKNFTARPNRDRHVRYHTGEKPYKCDLCQQAFHRGDDLKYHRTTKHTGAEPFGCTRCPATFSWGRDLEKHIRQGKCTV